MKRMLLGVVVLTATGCGCPEKPVPSVGKYSSPIATVIRKYELTGGHYLVWRVDLRYDGKVRSCQVGRRRDHDEDWYAGLVQGETYKVLVEEKPDGRYIWNYEVPPR